MYIDIYISIYKCIYIFIYYIYIYIYLQMYMYILYLYLYIYIFPSWGHPKNGKFRWEVLLKIDDMGYPYFRKPPYSW